MSAATGADRRRAGARRGLAAVLLALLAGAAAAPAPAGAQLAARPLMRPTGFAAGDNYGAALAPAGDLNGDGFDDFLVGAPYVNGTFPDAGRAYIDLGGAAADSVADLFVTGRTPSGRAGETLAGVGDVNGDGYDDWLVGSPNYDSGTAPRFAGKVWLQFGGSALDNAADRTLDSPNFGVIQRWGAAMTPAGDFNADGAPDFLVGGFAAAPDSNGASLYWGGADLDAYTDLTLHVPPSHIVRDATAGDLNGDGWTDVVVGTSSGFGGRLFVYHGGPGFDAEWDVDIRSGVTYNDNFGFALACGDLNGDGFDDLVVGAGGRNSNGLALAGEALVYFGGPSMDAVVDLVRSGTAANENYGISVAVPGDFDGDGYDDFVVGAWRARNGSGFDTGRVAVCFGGPAPDAVPDLMIDGEAGTDLFGAAVAGAGDPDRRGSPALLVGASQNDAFASNAGRAYVYRVSRFGIETPRPADRWAAGGTARVRWTGSDLASLDLSLDDGATWATLASGVGGAAVNELDVAVPHAVSGLARIRLTRDGAAPGSGESSLSDGLFHVVVEHSAPDAVAVERGLDVSGPGRPGTAVAAGVDLTGDAMPDVISGVPYLGNGSLRIRDETGGSWVETLGATPGEQLGAALANAGDLDGDGWDDLVAGAPACGVAGLDAGRVYWFRGGPGSDGLPDRILEGQRAGERFGAALAPAGDVDGDGAADLIVGAPGSGGEGRAYVFLGGAAFDATPDAVLTAGIPGPFGLAVAGAGDIDGDGHADLLAYGPPQPGGNGSGSVHLFFGSARPSRLDRLILQGESIGDGFGAALASLGDMDGDGFADFAIGAPLSDRGALDAGAVHVYSGTARFVPVPARVLAGAAPAEFFGGALAGGFDLNGDERPDLVIGAPGSARAGLDAGRIEVLFGGSDALADLAIDGVAGSRLGEAVAARSATGDAELGVLVAGAPFATKAVAIDAPAVRAFALARWSFAGGDQEREWIAGSRPQVAWRGREAADLFLVADDGTATRLGGDTGGASEHVLEVIAAASLPDSGRLELRAVDPDLRGRVPGPRVRLLRAVRLTRFDWTPRADGVALAWDTEPRIDAAGLAGYRLWREPREGGPRVAIGSGLLGASEIVDAEGRAGDRYTLVAVTALGAEYEAGVLEVPAAPLRLAVWPQPAAARGALNIAFAAPRAGGAIAADLEVMLFDAHGRWVTTLLRGRPETAAGVVQIRWDGRGHRGEAAEPGLYFLRVRAPSAGYEASRRVVLLDR